MLKAVDIKKKYYKKKDVYTEALSGVNLTLEDGSITVVVGDSGSGKSTLARILSYTEMPDEGRLFLNETEITGNTNKNIRRLRRNVQLVMQDAQSSLDPHLSGGRTLEEPLKRLLNMEKDARRRRVEELSEMMKLPGAALERRPAELSGGQQKRICIARALAAEPEHIIFDESFSGLDVTVKVEILDLIKRLQKEMKLSLMIITHDLETAMYMADKIHVMYCGRIIETVNRPESLSDFKENYSKELVKAALYKSGALHI